MNIETSTSPAKRPPLYAQTPNLKEQARKAQGLVNRDGTPSQSMTAKRGEMLSALNNPHVPPTFMGVEGQQAHLNRALAGAQS